jgi:hypothetical protein
MLKVYVAGAWVEQHQRARPMIAKLREAGVTITCDWTQAEGDVCACGHHRQRHAPFAEAEIDILRPQRETCCADCACPTFNGIGVGGDSKLTDEARKKYALADLQGVLDAEVVWLLAPNTQSAWGSWWELGAATCAQILRKSNAFSRVGPAIIVSGPKNKRTIFTELADCLLDSDADAFDAVLSINNARRA